jgi:hypothetical protein
VLVGTCGLRQDTINEKVKSFFIKNKTYFVCLALANSYFMKGGASRYMWAKAGYNK